MLVSSDEEFFRNDKTPISREHAAADVLSGDQLSESTIDAVSVTTTSSTLPTSGSDEQWSRDAASSTNRVAASSLGAEDLTMRPAAGSRHQHDASFVRPTEGDSGVGGPPWLQTGGSTSLQSDGLPSLQYGASGLLTFVYDRQSNNATPSFVSADRTSDATAVQYSSSSAMTTFGAWPSSDATAAYAAASEQHPAVVEVSVETADIHRTDEVPVTSDSVVENRRTEESCDVAVLSSASQCDQLISTTNSTCESSASHGGCESSVLASFSVVEDWPSDVTPLSDVDADDLRQPDCPISLSTDNINYHLQISKPTAVLYVDDNLLSGSEATGRDGLTNGWTGVDDGDADDLRSDDVDVHRTKDAAAVIADSTQVTDELRRLTQVNDARRTLSPISDGFPTEVVATCETAHDDDGTWVSSRYSGGGGACLGYQLNGHLPSTSTAGDDHVPCRACSSSDNPPPPSSVHGDAATHDVNSNTTSAAISTSGDDVTYDEIGSRDDDEACRRVAEQLSVAWNDDAERHSDPLLLLDGFDHMDGDLLLSTSPTLTAHFSHVSRPRSTV